MEKILYKGKTILYFDYRGLEDAAFISRLEENAKAVEKLSANGKGDFLRLSDVRDTYASPEIIEAIKNTALRTRKYFRASAVIGIKGGKKLLLDIVNRVAGIGARPFEDIEQAKEWLVEQAYK